MINGIMLLHYGTIGAIVALSGLGVSIGQGFAGQAVVASLNRQPSAGTDIARGNLLALAFIETAAILSLIIAMLLFFKVPTTLYAALAQLGIAFALAIPGFTIGIIASMPARQAVISIARQPFLSKKITNLMILAQSLLQTPLIFSFIISLLIRNQLDSITTASQSLRLIASGLCIGIASIGPAIGGGTFTAAACRAVGINKSAYGRIFSFAILSQAIIETPVIFASIISFWLATVVVPASGIIGHGILYLAIAFVMAIGTVGAGISSGRTAASACEQIAFNPEHYSIVSRTSLIAQGLIDTSAIYAFIIALFLLLVRL